MISRPLIKGPRLVWLKEHNDFQIFHTISYGKIYILYENTFTYKYIYTHNYGLIKLKFDQRKNLPSAFNEVI